MNKHKNFAMLVKKSVLEEIEAIYGEPLPEIVEENKIFVVFCAETDHEAHAIFTKENFEKNYGTAPMLVGSRLYFTVPE